MGSQTYTHTHTRVCILVLLRDLHRPMVLFKLEENGLSPHPRFFFMGPARPYALFKKRSRRVVLILLLFESGNELGSIKLLLNFFFLRLNSLQRFRCSLARSHLSTATPNWVSFSFGAAFICDLLFSFIGPGRVEERGWWLRS